MRSRKVLLFISDILVYFVSILLAWYFRGQLDNVLSELLVKISDLYVIVPTIIGIRLVLNIITDLYSVRVGKFSVYDLSRLVIVMALPSMLFIIFRIVSPIALIRLPFSVIVMEYAFSFFGALVIRLLFINFAVRVKKQKGIYINKITVYGDLNEVGSVVKDLADQNRIGIEAIISPNPLQWNQNYNSIPVLQFPVGISRTMKYDDKIMGILVADVTNVTNKTMNTLKKYSEEHNLQLLELEDGRIRPIYCPRYKE